MKKTGILLVAGAVILGGCVTDATTGERKVASTTWGALGGAAVGAGAGALIGGKKGALIGAAAGTALGAGVGLYMDNQNAELRNELQGTGVSVTKSGSDIILNMPGNITFKSASADLSGDFFAVLNSVAKVLKKYEKTTIKVVGHTDSTGDYKANVALSRARAETVGKYLISQGVKSGRIHNSGVGPDEPIANNSSAAGREQNRRVEITLTPLDQ